MRVLVLGGYGFIGAEIVRALIRSGHEVVALGRNAKTGRRLIPDATWIGADIATLDTPEKWAPHLDGADAIVNAAGALQDGPRDRLAMVHHLAIAGCVEAAETAGVRRFVQISAVGAEVSASTDFMRTKAQGDAAVKASSLDWTLLRPGLVIGRNAFGGTAMLRMLAAMPLVEALAFPDAQVQSVSIDDVTDAVNRGIAGEVPGRAAYDLVEDEPRRLRDIVRSIRRWQGFDETKFSVVAPHSVVAFMSLLADAAGLLGWRSPLRSTAMRVMSENVLGDPRPWRAVTGHSLKSFNEILRDLPSTAQERVYARAGLALPLMVATLGLFWIASGVIGLFEIERASAHLKALGDPAAKALVLGGSFLDIAIGAGILWRPTARRAAVLSIAVSAFYLAAGTITVPELWIDPFGPLVKVLPAMALAAATALLLEER